MIARRYDTGNQRISRGYLRLFDFPITGAHDRTRTGDPVLTKNVLYQLSYVGPQSPSLLVAGAGFEPA